MLVLSPTPTPTLTPTLVPTLTLTLTSTQVKMLDGAQEECLTALLPYCLTD